jgi:hypothetical protein
MIRWILDMFKRRALFRKWEQSRVPPPEWAAKRGGVEYW